MEKCIFCAFLHSANILDSGNKLYVLFSSVSTTQQNNCQRLRNIAALPTRKAICIELSQYIYAFFSLRFLLVVTHGLFWDSFPTRPYGTSGYSDDICYPYKYDLSKFLGNIGSNLLYVR